MSKSPKFYDFFPNFYRRIFFTSDDQNGRFQNRVISGNLGKIARFAIRVIPGIVLIEFVLSEDPLYLESLSHTFKFDLVAEWSRA